MNMANLNFAPHPPLGADEHATKVQALLAAKAATGKTFDQIAQECGFANAYTAQLFFGQAQLKSGSVAKLKAAVPSLTDHQLSDMQRCPLRRFDQSIMQEPLVYRLYEAITHYGAAIKAIVNEQQGDGIMSAIDMYASVRSIVGQHGENRVVITFNGKFLPHIQQDAAADTSAPQ